jgi:hypothetical protein
MCVRMYLCSLLLKVEVLCDDQRHSGDRRSDTCQIYLIQIVFVNRVVTVVTDLIFVTICPDDPL